MPYGYIGKKAVYHEDEVNAWLEKIGFGKKLKKEASSVPSEKVSVFEMEKALMGLEQYGAIKTMIKAGAGKREQKGNSQNDGEIT